LPLAVVTAVLVGLFLYGLQARLQDTAREDFVRDLQGIHAYWQVDTQHHINKLGAILAAITDSNDVRSAVERKCYKSLLANADPLFHDLNDRYFISSLTFLDPERRTLLRVHEPEAYGDTVSRLTAKRAESTGQLAHGWEFDWSGNLGLRAVLPWFHEGRLVGYVELAESIHHILHHVDELFGVSHMVVVRKEYLDHYGLTGIKAVDGIPVDWEQFPSVVLLHQTIAETPQRLEDMLRDGGLDPLADGMMLEQGERYYAAGLLPLTGSADEAVGQIVTLRDVTEARAGARRVMAGVSAAALALTALLSVFFFKITTRTEKELEGSYNELEDSHQQLLRAHREWVDSFDAIQEPIFLHDDEFRVLRANRAYAERAGVPADSIIGRPYFEIFPKGEGPLASCQKALKGKAGAIEEEEIQLETGEAFVSRAFYVRGDTYRYSVHILENITAHKQMREALRKENRAYKTVSESNQALIHATDEAGLMWEICRLVTDIGGYRLAWVGFKENDLAKTIKPVGYSGISLDELTALHATWADTEEGQNPSARAIRTSKPQMNADVLTNAPSKQCREVASCLGYASVLALPLLDGDKTFGVLTIGATEPNAFNEAEITLLDELAGDIAYGTVALHTRKEHAQAEQARLATLEKLKATLNKTVQAMAAALEARDPYTAGHQRRVAELAVAIARELAISPNQIEGIKIAATIHDIGKIYVPAEILSKPGNLSELEFALIKVHPQVGYDILRDIDFPWPVADMVLQHHEHLDGSGYPKGIAGDAILLESRILTVADVVESLLTHRPYRPALGIDAALDEIDKRRGTCYDPHVVDACLTLFQKKGYRLEVA